MKAVSKFALGLALATVPLMMAATPSWAEEKPSKEKKAKKGKDEKPAEFKVSLSKEFNAVYGPVVNEYVKTKDALKAAESWEAIKTAIKTPDDQYQAGVFGNQIGREANNSTLQYQAFDMLLASSKTPADQRQAFMFQKAALAYDSKDWVNAETWLIRAYDEGYRSKTIRGGVEMLIADTLNFQKKYPESLAWMEKSLEASKQPGFAALPDSFFPRGANVALKTKDPALITRWMTELVRNNPTPDFWHDALMQTYAASQLDTQEELDLMRLLRTVGGMKYEQNYSAYATDALIAFFPTEMKAVLEEGFAAGTISKNNATFGGRYSDVLEKLKIEPFSIAVLDQDIASAKTGAASAFAGDIALSVGEYARAKGAYEAAIATGSIVDKEGKDLMERTVMRLGIAKLKLGDVAGAQAEFAKVTSAGRRSVASYWALYAEQLAKTAPGSAA